MREAGVCEYVELYGVARLNGTVLVLALEQSVDCVWCGLRSLSQLTASDGAGSVTVGHF